MLRWHPVIYVRAVATASHDAGTNSMIHYSGADETTTLDRAKKCDNGKDMKTEFKQGSALPFCIFFAFVCLVIGSVTALVIKPWIGALVILAGIAIPVLVYYFATSYVISCDDDGFTVDQSSKRKGASHTEHRWSEVTRTEYEEFERSRSSDDSGPPTRYFSVYCGEQRSFKAGRISRFKQLIAHFNERATGVPYTWQPRTGISIQIGVLNVGRSAYVKVPR